MASPFYRTACIDCTRYDPRDPAAAWLAHISGLPYLLVYTQAVVAYTSRDLVAATSLAGLVANAALSKALKRALAQGRPPSLCAVLDTCHKPGMPSSHAQLLFFAAALHTLLTLRALSAAPGGMRVTGLRAVQRVVELGALLVLACVAAYSRVYLGYHTLPQIAAGGVVGALFGVVWFRVTRVLAQQVYPRLLRFRLAEALQLKCDWGASPAGRTGSDKKQ